MIGVRTLLGCGTALALAACAQVQQDFAAASPAIADPVGTAQSATWDSFVAKYIDASLAAYPPFAVYSGKHEYDGMLPDITPAGLAAEVTRLKIAIAAAQAFDPTRLSEDQRFERNYVIAQAKGALFWIDPAGADQPHRNPAFYTGMIDPSAYINVPYAPKEVKLRSYIKLLRGVPGALEQMRANLRTPLPTPFVDYAKNAFSGYAAYYPGDGTAAWEGVGTAQDQADLKAASDAATAAMNETVAWVEAQRGASKPNFALGADTYRRMLRDTEMVDISLAELKAIGERDLASNRKLLGDACGRYAPGKSIPDCMAKMSADKPADGPVAEARRQIPGLKQFLVEKDIVSIPGPEEAKVEEAPRYNRQNSAYINIPGPYETNLPSVYFIAPPDPSWSAEEQAGFIPGKSDLLFTSIHEIWPGHFLNFIHANRSPHFFGRLFVGYAYAEGWAHYTEELMRVEGVAGGTDEVMVGQLSNALLRDCRFLSSVGMHTGSMTQQDSYDLFRTKCYQDAGTARQQAARGTYDPGYLNYTLGKLMIRKLRDDWAATRGGHDAWKQFHDDFLSYGGPPIPLVRQQMMGEEKAKAVF